MNDILNHTTLQPLLFDFNDFSLSNNMPLSKKEAEFASYWNSIASMLPDSMFETNRMGRKGYRDADVLAVLETTDFNQKMTTDFNQYKYHRI